MNQPNFIYQFKIRVINDKKHLIIRKLFAIKKEGLKKLGDPIKELLIYNLSI